MFGQCARLILLVVAVCCGWSGVATATGMMTPAGTGLPALVIREHNVNVVIEDGYAITTVEQVFHNPWERDLEGMYSFPVPEKAAVSEFTVWIDGQPVTGEVFEKKQARKIYEEEQAAGRDAGLTEKDEYKTFDIRVSPVRAGQDTKTRLSYMQPIDVDMGIGRYVYPLEDGGVDDAKASFWSAGKEVTGVFSFDMNLRSSYPVDAVRLPGNPDAVVNRVGEGEWNISMGEVAASRAPVMDEDVSDDWVPFEHASFQQSPQVAYTLGKDIVVYWRHAPSLPGSVDLVTYRPDPGRPGTFMLVVTPGDDLQPITEGKDWVFVLDISGSMQGKFATLAEGVLQAFEKMGRGDRFRIVVFNNRARELTRGYEEVTPESIGRYSRKLENIVPGHGTNLFGGVAEALSGLESDRTSSIVLVTDGVANVGPTQKRMFLELLEKKDVRLFTFVMGNSANRPLLEAMSKASNGFAMNVSNSDDIIGRLLQATEKVGYEALHGVELDIHGIRTSGVTPSHIGSLYRGQQLVVFGHYSSHGEATVELSGRISGDRKVYRTSFEFPEASVLNPELERLWAFATIDGIIDQRDMFGENEDLKQAVVDLGIEYGLVTDYTSMLVLSEEQFVARNVARRNLARVAEEKNAQQQRAQQPVQPRRADTQKTMFKSNRAHTSSGGGSGSFGPWGLLLLLPLVALRFRQDRGR